MPLDNLVVEFVAIEPRAAEMPTLLHPFKSTRASRFRLRRQNALATHWHGPRDRLAVAGNCEFLTRLDLADERENVWLASRSVIVLAMTCV
jgi:hypothetical protein